MTESMSRISESTSFKLVAHHIGARGYGVSFNLPETFRGDVVHVLYEADADAVQSMQSQHESAHAKMLSEKYVLPFCMGRRYASAQLNITANSYASSLLPPNPAFFAYYCEIPIDAATYDVTYRDMLEVVRTVDLEVHALDDLFAAGRIPVPATPDFLSLDTQGYELEILEGAKQTIADGVLGIVSEVEMIPMYSGQPLLGDILNFATANGFLFAGFTTMFSVSPHRAPIGMRGKALPGFGDALFLRNLDTLSEDRIAPDRLYVMLLKLAFIATSFSLIEYALAALERAKPLRDRVARATLEGLQPRKYFQFLEHMGTMVDEAEPHYPPVHSVPDDSRPAGDRRTSWYDKHHQAALRRYAESRAEGANPAEPVARSDAITALGQSNFGRVIVGWLPDRAARALRRRLRAFASPSVSAAPVSASAAPTYSRFEALLDDWGFAGAMHLVRERRLAVEPFVRSLDESMRADGAHAHLARR